MKNNSILTFLLLLILGNFQSNAQDSKFRLGIRFAPNLAMTRVLDVKEDDGIKFENNGVGLRFSAGLTGDFYFGKNYSFYTGLWYSVQRAGIKFSDADGTSGKAIHNLQYVQIPVALKLFTNEIATDTKLYFVLGSTLGLKIDEKEKEWEVSGPNGRGFSKPGAGNSYSYFDAGLLLGAGAEMQMGENTILFGGLSYNRGLVNVQSDKGSFNDKGKKASDSFKITNSLLSLEVGIKF